MDKKTTIDVNTTSIVDLKAELYRKQEEFKRDRIKHGDIVKGKTVEKKPNIWSKKNRGVLQRAQRDAEIKREEDTALEDAKSKLEAKAKLYEKMTQGRVMPDEKSEEVFLVDFHKKAYDTLQEEKKKQQEKIDKEKESNNQDTDSDEVDEPFPEAANSDEEWVDYTDSLGRSRRCIKKDLKHLIELDKKLAPVKERSTSSEDASKPELMSSDMYREMLRKKWEAEELEALNKPAGPIHYANVQFDEIRTHGVGYYQFSKDDEARQEQMEKLEQFRQQTKDQRERRDKIKEKRKAILQARLAKVKERKKIKLGDEDSEAKDQEGADTKSDTEDTIGPSLSERWQDTDEAKLLQRDDSWKKDAPVREWDKGKTGFPSAFATRPNPHEERNEEFAPPQEYYEPQKSNNKQKLLKDRKAIWQRKKEEREKRMLDKKIENKKLNAVQTPEDISQIPLPDDKPLSQESQSTETTQFVAENQSHQLGADPPGHGQLPNPFNIDISQPPPGFYGQVQPPYNYPQAQHSAYPQDNVKQFGSQLPATQQLPYSTPVQPGTAEYGNFIQNLPSSLPLPPNQLSTTTSYPSQQDPYSWGDSSQNQSNPSVISAPPVQNLPTSVLQLDQDSYKKLIRKLPSSLPPPPSLTQPYYPSQSDPYSWGEGSSKPEKASDSKTPAPSAYTVTKIQSNDNLEHSEKGIVAAKPVGKEQESADSKSIDEALKYFKTLSKKNS